jgi:hypothetical protein
VALVDFNGQELVGIDAITEAALALGERNPVGHHVTNVVVSGARRNGLRSVEGHWCER